jgi:hypothetical protein
MYHENNFWKWLGAFILGLIAVVGDAAFLADLTTKAWNWGIQSGFIKELVEFTSYTYYLVLFYFTHYWFLVLIIFIYWRYYERNSRF